MVLLIHTSHMLWAKVGNPISHIHKDASLISTDIGLIPGDLGYINDSITNFVCDLVTSLSCCLMSKMGKTIISFYVLGFQEDQLNMFKKWDLVHNLPHDIMTCYNYNCWLTKWPLTHTKSWEDWVFRFFKEKSEAWHSQLGWKQSVVSLQAGTRVLCSRDAHIACHCLTAIVFMQLTCSDGRKNSPSVFNYWKSCGR